MSEKFVIFHIEGGAGKSVAATAVCSSIKASYPEHKLIVVTPWPEVFLHNPNIYRVYKSGIHAYFYEDFVRNKDSVILRGEPYHHSDFINKKGHIIEIWCKLFGVPCITKQPQLFLTQRELINASGYINKQGPIMMIQNSGGADGQEFQYSWARDLSQGFSQALVNSSKDNFNKIFHIRRNNQPALEHTTQITAGLRDMFCFVYFADKLVLIDSLIQHVAAALQKPAVVGWIANSPETFGYDIHTNITPSLQPSFRHMIDSYLEDYDWVGRRMYECPYDDIDNILSQKPFLDYISGSPVTFDKMPTSNKKK